MQVVEKMHHINVSINGNGLETILEIIKSHIPSVQVIADSDDDEYVDFTQTDFYKDVKAQSTPGLILKAYREREGLSITELAEKVGTKYPNISAMENDRRVIGLRMAKKLGEILKVDFNRFLA